MQKTTLIGWISCLMLVSACSSVKIQNPHSKKTPGCVPINTTLLCDQTEVSNFHWMEYLYWTKTTYGDTSEAYLSALPDEMVWEDVLCDSTYAHYYLMHPSYRNYPVVGITQEQARAYSKWRSDRVFEYTLIKEGVLPFNPRARDSSAFTIERYFSGLYEVPVVTKGDTVYERVPPDFSIAYPIYRLPNNSDRLAILDYIDSTDFLFHRKKERTYMSWRANNLPFLLEHQPCINDSLVSDATRTVNTYLDKSNNFKLIHNSRGNVAEWAEEQNITYGGGWPHNVEYIMAKDTVSCATPNAWTGMRNVCEWHYWKP